MSADFIFMLTHSDRTVHDALARLPEVLESGVRHIGFKDIGLPLDQLEKIATLIREGGGTVYLEVVSSDAESEVASAHAAVRLGVDVLMGGTNAPRVLPVIAGTPIRYFPFAGRVIGHPSRLHGTISEIAASAETLLSQHGVAGVDLLAYRFSGDVLGLMRSVCSIASGKKVVIAGSIDRAERIEAALSAGASAITVGTAAIDGVFPAPKRVPDQIAFITGVMRSHQPGYVRRSP